MTNHAMLDGNSAALNRYLDNMDKAEALAPTDREVKTMQEQMYWDRLHDLDKLGDALDITEMGDCQYNLLSLIGQLVARRDTIEAGRLLGELLESRLYPSEPEAEYALRNPE